MIKMQNFINWNNFQGFTLKKIPVIKVEVMKRDESLIESAIIPFSTRGVIILDGQSVLIYAGSLMSAL